jgi:hypothetical protein
MGAGSIRPEFNPVRIGLDFDNTIVSYDELMSDIAVGWGLIDAGLRRNKKIVRDQLRSLPDGESHWRRLQTYAYGEGMAQARPMDGVLDFLRFCRAKSIPIWIVSHKTEYNNFGPPTVNLRQAAMQWLAKHGFFNEAITGLIPARVFFETTREEKVARIATLAVSHFVDDLDETFLEPTFPPDVGKIHFVSHGEASSVPGALDAATWPAILAHIQSIAAGQSAAVSE